MLRLAATFNATQRLLMLLSGWCAYDTETGLYVRRSAGRRRGGRATRYYLGRLEWDRLREEQRLPWPPPPKDVVGWEGMRVTARSDAEALAKFNQRMAARPAEPKVSAGAPRAGNAPEGSQPPD